MLFTLMGYMLYLKQIGTIRHNKRTIGGHEESSDKMCNSDLTYYKGS